MGGELLGKIDFKGKQALMTDTLITNWPQVVPVYPPLTGNGTHCPEATKKGVYL
jgi:hypothetical protein